MANGHAFAGCSGRRPDGGSQAYRRAHAERHDVQLHRRPGLGDLIPGGTPGRRADWRRGGARWGTSPGASSRLEARMVGVKNTSLGELRRRTSAKWRTYPPDVLPLPVAEMDFPIAAPIAEALHAAIRRSDLGYAHPTPERAEALTGFTARRWGWRVDPAQLTLAPEVGAAVVEALR